MLRLQSGHMFLTRLLLDGYSWGLFPHNEHKKLKGGGISQLNHILCVLWLGVSFSNGLPSRALGTDMPHEGHVTEKALKCYSRILKDSSSLIV